MRVERKILKEQYLSFAVTFKVIGVLESYLFYFMEFKLTQDIVLEHQLEFESLKNLLMSLKQEAVDKH